VSASTITPPVADISIFPSIVESLFNSTVSVVLSYCNFDAPAKAPPSLNCTCGSSPPGEPPPPPPVSSTQAGKPETILSI